MKKTLAIISALAMAFTMTTATVAFAEENEAAVLGNAAVGEAYNFKVNVLGEGQVTYAVGDGELTYDNSQSAAFTAFEGDVVRLGAKAADGYAFLYWYDEANDKIVSEEAEMTVTASQDMDLYAVFEYDGETVDISVGVEGEGMIEGSNDGTEPEIDEEFPMQSVALNVPVDGKVILIAKAKEGYVFRFWIDTDDIEFYSTDARFEFTADKDRNIVAYFEPDVDVEQIKANIEGEGMIDGTNDGTEPEIDEEYPYQSVVINVPLGEKGILLAKAKEGWKFKNWIDADTKEVYSTEARIEITADTADKVLSLTAVFVEDTGSTPDTSTPDSSKPGSNPKTGAAGAMGAGAVALIAATAAVSVKKRK